jgi:hypothetical protein
MKRTRVLARAPWGRFQSAAERDLGLDDLEADPLCSMSSSISAPPPRRSAAAGVKNPAIVP